MTRPSRALSWPALLILAACSVGPRYHRPALAMPGRFAQPQARPAPPPGLSWWRSFGDPDLDRLMALAARDSLDMRAAMARVVQADQAARVAGSPLLPGLTGSLQQNYQRTGEGSGAYAGLPAGEAALFGGNHHYTDSRSYAAELSASYEVDFWGMNADALRAAQATALGARYDAQTTWLTTASSIATTYFQAAGYLDRLAIAEHDLAAAKDVLAAYRGQLAAGTASLLDVSQQEALVAGYRAQIPALRGAYVQNVLALGILVGLPPERITIAPQRLAALRLPVVAAGLPADLLRRRPDVAYAEAQLIAQNQVVRQDVANFYPALQLTASGGLSSTVLSAVTGPGTVVASLASSLSQTIFDNGNKEGTLGEARGRYLELAADYEKSVLQALTDTETALAQLHYAADQQRLDEDAVRTAQKSADIARAQLAAGTINIITVLNTETTLFTDQDTLAQARVSRVLALVSLYKALGGGWAQPAHSSP